MCSYLRAVSKSGEVHCALVMGKARIAPTKVRTISRLELSAAVVATRTSDLLKREMEIEGLQEYFWTDSKVVLGYINNDEKRFHAFLANRIQQIKSSTEPSQWQYVASENNLADHASRGLSTMELVESNWFTGPNILWQKDVPKREEIWTRWRKEYVLNLQQRSKWNKDRRNAKVNNIALLQDDGHQEISGSWRK